MWVLLVTSRFFLAKSEISWSIHGFCSLRISWSNLHADVSWLPGWHPPLHTYTSTYPIKSPLNLMKFLWNQNSTFSYLIPFHIAQVAPGASKCRAVMCGRRTFGGPPGQLGKNGEKLGFSDDFSRNWTKHREFIHIFPTNWRTSSKTARNCGFHPRKTRISLDNFSGNAWEI